MKNISIHDYISTALAVWAIVIVVLTFADILLYLSLPDPPGFIYFDTADICLNNHDGIYWSGVVARFCPAVLKARACRGNADAS